MDVGLCAGVRLAVVFNVPSGRLVRVLAAIHGNNRSTRTDRKHGASLSDSGSSNHVHAVIPKPVTPLSSRSGRRRSDVC